MYTTLPKTGLQTHSGNIIKVFPYRPVSLGYSAFCHIKKSQYWLGILTDDNNIYAWEEDLHSFWHDNPPRRINDNMDSFLFL